MGGGRENECGFYLYSFTYQKKKKKNEHGLKKKKKASDYNNWGIMTEATLDENGGCIGTLCGQR